MRACHLVAFLPLHDMGVALVLSPLSYNGMLFAKRKWKPFRFYDMMIRKGEIGVSTSNIFPIIKKFLYSDHEIFIREIVSNAVDAIQKMKTLADVGDYQGELGDLAVRVVIDKKKRTLIVSDRGIGMTAEEVDKYINQIALSSANDFLDKYKENECNHRPLRVGLYSSFMVAKRVEIITKSYREESPAVKWACDGSPEFTMERWGKRTGV